MPCHHSGYAKNEYRTKRPPRKAQVVLKESCWPKDLIEIGVTCPRACSRVKIHFFFKGSATLFMALYLVDLPNLL